MKQLAFLFLLTLIWENISVQILDMRYQSGGPPKIPVINWRDFLCFFFTIVSENMNSLSPKR